MHQAPAVRVLCPGSPGWRAARSLLAAGATLVLGAWGLRVAGLAVWPAWVGSALMALAALMLTWRRLRDPGWLLGWNGSRWSLASDTASEPVDVQAMDVMIDLGRWLLLRARLADGGSHWLAVGWTGQISGDHKALCTALYAQRSRSTIPALPDRPPR